MFCNECGADAPANAAFCPQCGAQLKAGAAVTGRPVKAERLHSSVDQASARDVPESELWAGSYSPKAMTGWYIPAAILTIVALVGSAYVAANAWMVVAAGAVVLFALLALYATYKRMSLRFQLTSHRFVIQRGILGRSDNRVLLVDIDDINVRQSWIERLLNVGTITLHTSDETTKEESPDPESKNRGVIILEGIEDPRGVADLIDESRRAERTRRGVYTINA